MKSLFFVYSEVIEFSANRSNKIVSPFIERVYSIYPLSPARLSFRIQDNFCENIITDETVLLVIFEIFDTVEKYKVEGYR